MFAMVLQEWVHDFLVASDRVVWALAFKNHVAHNVRVVVDAS